MHKIKINGAVRPKKRTNIRNLFNIGNCKWLNKNRKMYKPSISLCYKDSQIRNLDSRSSEEAKQILETVEKLGFQVTRGKKEVIKD